MTKKPLKPSTPSLRDSMKHENMDEGNFDYDALFASTLETPSQEMLTGLFKSMGTVLHTGVELTKLVVEHESAHGKTMNRQAIFEAFTESIDVVHHKFIQLLEHDPDNG